MSDSKPEKVKIKFGSKPDDKDRPEKDSKVEDQKPAISNFPRGAGATEAEATDTKEEPKLRSKTEKKIKPREEEKSDAPKVEEVEKETTTSPAVLDHPDVRDLDGGFAADMYRPGHTFTPEGIARDESGDDDLSKTTESDPNEVDNTEQPDQTPDENDALYSRDEDFYSSKFNPKQPKQKHREKRSGQRTKRGSRPWLLLGLLLLALVAGFAALYYLELSEAGAGLIFDHLPFEV